MSKYLSVYVINTVLCKTGVETSQGQDCTIFNVATTSGWLSGKPVDRHSQSNFPYDKVGNAPSWIGRFEINITHLNDYMCNI